MIAILLLRYSDYRGKPARYDGFRGRAMPMKVLMGLVGILGFPAWLIYMYLRITAG